MDNTTVEPKVKELIQKFVTASSSGRNRTYSKMNATVNKSVEEKFTVLNECVLGFVRKEVMSSDEPITIEYGNNQTLTFSDKPENGLKVNSLNVMPITKVLVEYYDTILKSIAAFQVMGIVELPTAHKTHIENCLKYPKSNSRKVNGEIYSLLLILREKGYDSFTKCVNDEFVLDKTGNIGLRMLNEGYKYDVFKERVKPSEKQLTTRIILKEMCSWINISHGDSHKFMDILNQFE